MFRIAICDDEAGVRRTSEAWLRQLLQEMAVDDMEVLTFSDASQLLDHYPNGLDVLLMDIQMPGLNGIEAAREIRGFDTAVTLVFMTNYAKYAIEGYSVHAYNYLLKPLSQVEFNREMRPVVERCVHSKSKTITLHTGAMMTTVQLADIVWCETDRKYSLIHLTNQVISCGQNIKHIESKVEKDGFFRIHTGYLINMDWVQSIGRDMLTLRGDVTLPISKHRKKDFMDAYLSYVGRLM